MDISRQDLEKRYSKLSNNELLDIYTNREGYTFMAIHVAFNELRRRRLNKEDFEDFDCYKTAKADERFQREHFRELNIMDKLFFYYMAILVSILWIFFALLHKSVIEEGYKLKAKQGIWFFCFGFFFFFTLFFELGFYIWLAGFLIPFYFDLQDSRRRREIYKRIFGHSISSKE